MSVSINNIKSENKFEFNNKENIATNRIAKSVYEQNTISPIKRKSFIYKNDIHDISTNLDDLFSTDIESPTCITSSRSRGICINVLI